MRIAFDLDDTLIPTTREFSVGSEALGFPVRLFFGEQLRNGAAALLQDIANEHELWIYTTSLRPQHSLKIWFKLWGVRIDSIVNQQRQQKDISRHHLYSRFSKSPSFYGIDLLIDDLEGVAIECDAQGCESLILSPRDDRWVETVWQKIEQCC